MKIKAPWHSNNSHLKKTMRGTIEHASTSARTLDGQLQDLLTKMVGIDKDICKLEERRLLIEEQINDVRKAYHQALDTSLQYRKWEHTMYHNKRRRKPQSAA